MEQTFRYIYYCYKIFCAININCQYFITQLQVMTHRPTEWGGDVGEDLSLEGWIFDKIYFSCKKQTQGISTNNEITF